MVDPYGWWTHMNGGPTWMDLFGWNDIDESITYVERGLENGFFME